MHVAIPFVGGAYEARSKNLDIQSCINLYLERANDDSKSPIALLNTPGTRFVVDCGNVLGRKCYTSSSGRPFFVMSSTLFELTSNFNLVNRGTLQTTYGTVGMSDNGQQLIVVDGQKGYLLDLATNNFTLITDPNFTPSLFVDYMDGYFILHKPGGIGTGLFQLSNLLDGSTWNGLLFGSAEGSPDPLLCVCMCNRLLYAFGSRSLEVFWNSGDASFTFDRIDGSFSNIGAYTLESIRKLRSTIFWLGASPDGSAAVWYTNNYTPTRVSTIAVEQDLDKWTDAKAWSYEKEGHAFYIISSQIMDKTWCYDMTTDSWSKRTYYDPITNLEHAYHVCDHAYAFQQNLVITPYSGKIYLLDNDCLTDDGNTITRERTAQYVHTIPAGFVKKTNEKVRHLRLHIDMEAGVGSGDGTTLAAAQDPQAMITWTDNGHTWSTPVWASIGKAGQYSYYIDVQRLGFSRSRAYRVRYSAPVKLAIIGADLIIEDVDNE